MVYYYSRSIINEAEEAYLLFPHMYIYSILIIKNININGFMMECSIVVCPVTTTRNLSWEDRRLEDQKTLRLACWQGQLARVQLLNTVLYNVPIITVHTVNNTS